MSIVDNNILIRVSARSQPKKVAGAIAGMIRDQKHVCVRAIGHDAMVKTIYALDLAGKFLLLEDLSLRCSIKSANVSTPEGSLLLGYEFTLSTNSNLS